MNCQSTNSNEDYEDVFSKLDLCTILLYTYEWKICKISMINSVSKPVVSPVFSIGPCLNFDLKILLSSLGYDVFKIEVRLIKECRLTDEMKFKEATCPLTSKSRKHILGLEFLDHSGNIALCYKSLPYEFKLINTTVVYAWTKEENISSFIQSDSITIRAKLSMRFYSDSAETPSSFPDEPTNVLLKDMTKLFNERNSSPDLIIKIKNKYVPCHKSIVYSQCPYFLQIARNNTDVVSDAKFFSSSEISTHVNSMINNNCEILHILNTSVNVFLSVLYFIYTKQLQSFHTVDDFDVYEFAKEYAIRDLSMFLMPTEIKVHSEIIVKELNYTWYLKNFSSFKNRITSIQSPEFNTEIGSEDIIWNIVVSFVDSNNILLDLKNINGQKPELYAIFKAEVYNAIGSIYDKRESKYLFAAGTLENCLPEASKAMSPFFITSDLLYNDTLRITYNLKVTCNQLSSNIKYHYYNEHPAIDFSYWVNNFTKLLETGDCSDFILSIEKKEFRVHKAVLAARSPVFARMFESDMKEKRRGCVRIEDISSTVMEKALRYIYTCKIDDLSMTNASALYYVADKYALLDLKRKCCEFMAQNLDAENVCEILFMADLHIDKKLKAAAKKVISHNARQALLSLRDV